MEYCDGGDLARKLYHEKRCFLNYISRDLKLKKELH